MDDALMGAVTDITDKVQIVGILTGVTNCIFSPLLLGNFDGFSADGDKVTAGLSDGSTDESDDVWMERNFPRYQTFGKFCTAICMGIFAMNLANCWTDRTDDRHTDGWMEFQVESHLG